MTAWTRRRVLGTLLVASSQSFSVPVAGAGTAPTLGAGTPFSFERLKARARDLANAPFSPRATPASDIASKIDYDAHGEIGYRRDAALFADGTGAFPVTFFHLGRLFQKPVQMHVVDGGRSAAIRYDPAYFDIPQDNPARRMPADAGFAGFRVHEWRKRGDWAHTDWAAFLGASYFRAIGALEQYGLSARGIAVDTATATGEEFPAFVEFHIEPAPTPRDPVTVHALLDGPSIAGAYRFELSRTAGVVMDVEAHLFLRRAVTRLGIAPLTSMFWYAQHDKPYRADWRPEVHDSDGLCLWRGNGERIWRPLNNPAEPRVSSFQDTDPRGFGLFQRDRDFANYRDGVHYERRPSAWVEPLAPWGDGAVELIELPTNNEIHDNIVAAWRPAQPIRAGDELTFRYRLHWVADHPHPSESLARCVGTWVGAGGERGAPALVGTTRFAVAFAGGVLDTLGSYAQPRCIVEASRGKLLNIRAEHVPETGRWRAIFDLAANGTAPVELRLYLRQGDRALTETWLYQHVPERTA
ncbi:glucans biosynthesis protein [Limimonas halophila]|uniref:Glucans biosynthesis protein n=1 Tax=Limimonas halophila TaxID=1082479 RepID=A0A1G7LTX0_9PROT|nr:glucan biosynthesis protein [Limimonas halophila]SDF52861.1 glucans biosynthesis protein [Limimonas halophila]